MRRTLINQESTPLWIPYKYERLTNLCFKCGVIMHDLSRCKYTGLGNKMHDNELNQYETLLRASATKITRKNPSISSEKNSLSGSSSYEKKIRGR